MCIHFDVCQAFYLRPKVSTSIFENSLSKALRTQIPLQLFNSPNRIMVVESCLSHNICNISSFGSVAFNPYVMPEQWPWTSGFNKFWPSRNRPSPFGSINGRNRALSLYLYLVKVSASNACIGLDFRGQVLGLGLELKVETLAWPRSPGLGLGCPGLSRACLGLDNKSVKT